MSAKRHAWRTALLALSLCLPIDAAADAAADNPCLTHPAVLSDDPPVSRKPRRELIVASLNIAGEARVADSLVTWASERSLDVLLLQEVGNESNDGEAFVADIGRRLGLSFAYAPATSFDTGSIQGLAIVSRYPLSDVRIKPLEYHRLRFRSRCRVALAATVHTPSGPVRLVNVHLDTRINSRSRVAQLIAALESPVPLDGPRIIGGDFNTVNVGWLHSMWPFPFVQRQSNAVHSRLSSEGFETPLADARRTFKFLGLPLFKLDWLYLKGLQALAWGVDDVPLTDHRGVWIQLMP